MTCRSSIINDRSIFACKVDLQRRWVERKNKEEKRKEKRRRKNKGIDGVNADIG